MTIALYAGSFDPFTNGHLDILEQASKIFDKVIIAVACNREKTGFLPVEKRLLIIKESTSHLNNVEITSYEGLTVDFAKEKNANVLIRGIRNSKDFDYEFEMAQVNKKLNPDINTLFLTPKPENICISSSMVREVLEFNGDVSSFIPFDIKKYF